MSKINAQPHLSGSIIDFIMCNVFLIEKVFPGLSLLTQCWLLFGGKQTVFPFIKDDKKLEIMVFIYTLFEWKLWLLIK